MTGLRYAASRRPISYPRLDARSDKRGRLLQKRARSPFWQITFRDATGRWRYKSIRTAEKQA
jgi:hypothetical protein